jgi:ferredoxin, 2Fe-2S
MPKITYIADDGTEIVANVTEGFSVMEGAVANGVEGIEAVCGGACACATCHVYVDAAWEDLLDTKSDSEDAMLDFAANVQSNSRLSCQLVVRASLDGMVVRIPNQSN